MKNQKRTGRGRLLVCLVVCSFGLVFVPSAGATTNIYWGYNNMTISNPPSGTCLSQGAGVACAGFNNWDRTQVGYDNGDASIGYEFQNCAGCAFRGYLATSAGTWTLLRTDWNAAFPCCTVNPYNRTTCNYASAPLLRFAYVQCRAIIF